MIYISNLIQFFHFNTCFKRIIFLTEAQNEKPCFKLITPNF